MSRALVICNQYGNLPPYSLNGCFNDGNNIIERLKKIDPNINITLMRDDLNTNSQLYPNKSNIIREFNRLCTSRETLLFFYFSGHGTYIEDFNRDEQTIRQTFNGRMVSSIQSLLKDSCIVTNEGNSLNVVSDDEFSQILRILVPNKKLYAFMDACHTGTGLDLCNVYMGSYSGKFISQNMSELENEIKRKCVIMSASYPDKTKSVRANVISISGTRDKDLSYESSKQTSNGIISSGHFTDRLCWLLDYGVNNMNLKNFYFCLISLLNDSKQIPVLTCSQNLNLDSTMINDLVYKNNPKTTIQLNRVPLMKPINKAIEEESEKQSSKRLLYKYLIISQNKKQFKRK
jgi:hypothetical protein